MGRELIQKTGKYMQRREAYIFTIMAVVVLFAMPIYPEHAPTDSLDFGFHAALSHWLGAGKKFGQDIIVNTGPLGFLSYPSIYSHEIDGFKFIYWSYVPLTAVYFFVNVLKATDDKLLGVTIVLSVLLFGNQDVVLYFSFVLIVFSLFHKVTFFGLFLFAWFCVLASLTKGTMFFISLFAVLTVLLSLIVRKNLRAAGWTALWIGVASGASMNILGYSLTDLGEYIRVNIKYSQDYVDSMARYEGSFILLMGVAWLLIMSIQIGATALYQSVRERNIDYILYGLFAGFVLFVAWKHGFVRADMHVYIFFSFCLAIAPMCYIGRRRPSAYFAGAPHQNSTSQGRTDFRVPSKNTRRHWTSTMRIASIVSVVLLAIISFTYAKYSFGWNLPGWKSYYEPGYVRLGNNIRILLRLPSHIGRLKSGLEKFKISVELPAINELLEGQDVAYYGYELAPMLYNKFIFKNPPAPDSYTSRNQWVMIKNQAFYKHSDSAPQHILYELQTIDGRFPLQDDSLAHLEILNRYQPVSIEKNLVLFTRREASEKFSLDSFKEISTRRVKLNNPITVPKFQNDDWLWIEVKLIETTFSPILSLFYKPSLYTLDIVDRDGNENSYRFLPEAAKVGFVLNPILKTTKDIISLYGNSVHRKANTIQFTCRKLKWACAVEAEVTFRRFNKPVSEIRPQLVRDLLNRLK